MRDLFPGYYRPSDEELKRKFGECVFCFDTNTLLNLYRYSKKSRSQLLAFLDSVKDRIWVPYQVAFEFQCIRIEVLTEQYGLPARLADICQKAITDCKSLSRSELFIANAATAPIIKELEALREKVLAQAIPVPDVMTGDEVFESVSNLLAGNIGKPYSTEEMQDIIKLGRQRYEEKRPPGYLDKSPKCGDYIIWRQLLDYAKNESRPIILVTDDVKEDWFREYRGKRLGPRPELIDEFLAVAGQGKWFYMYSTEQCLRFAVEFLNAEVNSEVIVEAQNIEVHNVEQAKHRVMSADPASFSVKGGPIDLRTENLHRLIATLGILNALMKKIATEIEIAGVVTTDSNDLIACYVDLSAWMEWFKKNGYRRAAISIDRLKREVGVLGNLLASVSGRADHEAVLRLVSSVTLLAQKATRHISKVISPLLAQDM